MKSNKKCLTVISLLTALCAVVYARPMGMGRTDDFTFRDRLPMPGPYVKAELESVKSDLSNKAIGELTIAELSPYWDKLNTAQSKDVYLKQAYRMSFFMPGAGQFRDGEIAKGFGFSALNLTVMTGTLVGFYYLLPADLRFDKLDYFNTSFRKIDDTWNSHTLNEYLPSMGMMALGCILNFGIRAWSAEDAYAGAKTAVDSGKAKLELSIAPGYFGMGMRF